MLLYGLFAKHTFGVKIALFFFLSLLGLIISINLVWVLSLNQTDILNVQLSQLIFASFGMAMPAIAAALLFRKEDESVLHIRVFPPLVMVMSVIVLMLLLMPVINIIALWNEQWTFPESFSTIEAIFRTTQQRADELTLRLLEQSSYVAFSANLFFLALVPAITEELFFRGTLQSLLQEKIGRHLAVWLVAIIFSLFHMQFFGFVPRLLLGGMLGYLLLWSKSIYLPIIAHFTNNASIVLFYYLASKGVVSFSIEDVGKGNQWWMALLCVVLVLPICFFLYKRRVKTITITK